jgi:antitoxin Phd
MLADVDYDLDSLASMGLTKGGDGYGTLAATGCKKPPQRGKALRNGPQVVTRRGKKTVVIMSVEQYQRLIKPKVNIVDFFQESPLRGEDLDLTRKKDVSREVAI